jgi:hypothetical protein
MKKFIFRLIILTIALLILSILFAKLAPDYLVSQGLVYLPAMFLCITIITKYIVFRGSKLQHEKLLKNYMLAVGVKFFLFIGIMITYAIIWPKDSVRFILSFFVFYLIYTIFDSFFNFKIFKNAN